MKKLLLATLLLSAPAFAWDNPAINEPYREDSGYTSPSGSRYQYDRSKPVDNIRYESDYKAQQRDSMRRNNSYDNIVDDAYGQLNRGAGLYD